MRLVKQGKIYSLPFQLSMFFYPDFSPSSFKCSSMFELLLFREHMSFCLYFQEKKVLMVPLWLFEHTSKSNCLGCQKFMKQMEVCSQMNRSYSQC